jgi:hypothetical protein
MDSTAPPPPAPHSQRSPAEAFEVSQELFAVASVYTVRKPGNSEPEYTIFGAFATTVPRFSLVAGANSDADPQAWLVGNMLKTQYEVTDNNKLPLASVDFPAIAFKKTVQLTLKLVEGIVRYTADGGVFKGAFEFRDSAGNVGLEVQKEFGLRDTFSVKVYRGIPVQVGLLCATAIHSRYYELM